MATFLQRIREKRRARRAASGSQARQNAIGKQPVQPGVARAMDIAPNDPLVAYFLSSPGAVEIDKLQLESPTLKELKKAGVTVTIPLVSQGELLGLINLEGRLNEQDYSSSDRGLLNSLATQVTPALRMARMVLEQQAQEDEREHIEQALVVARLIQQTLLPKELPDIPDWHLTTFYQPARAVGGDFYDFIEYEDGCLGLVVGDVTEKGVPAALVMATTRSILRAAAQEEPSPGKVLERVNDLLCPDIPPRMFVTCFYAVLDPRSGHLHYANAGHNLPYRWHDGKVAALRATGIPLGLMPSAQYEEKVATLAHGESVLLYSDGLVEAHNPEREMFGFPRLAALLSAYQGGASAIDYLRDGLASFTGEGWEQEDDITLVTLRHALVLESEERPANTSPVSEQTIPGETGRWKVLDTRQIPSEVGNERLAISYVTEALKAFNLPDRRLEQLGTAVAEATMNAMEHGNHYNPEVPVTLQVLAADDAIAVRISDQGGNSRLPIQEEYEAPDIEAKLAELQSPRGWGLFLIQNMVDEMHILSDEETHTIELILRLQGNAHAHQNA